MRSICYYYGIAISLHKYSALTQSTVSFHLCKLTIKRTFYLGIWPYPCDVSYHILGNIISSIWDTIMSITSCIGVIYSSEISKIIFKIELAEIPVNSFANL